MFLRGSVVPSLTSVASIKWLYPHCGQVKCIPLCARSNVTALEFNGRILKWRLLHLEIIRARNARRLNTGGYITTQLNMTLSKHALVIHVGVVTKKKNLLDSSCLHSRVSVCLSVRSLPFRIGQMRRPQHELMWNFILATSFVKDQHHGLVVRVSDY